MRDVYYRCYPKRFQRAHQWTRECLPRGLVRKKNKCHDESGLCCERPHAHERILVDTSRMPGKFADRQFTRAWQQMLMNDPLRGNEVWSMKNLRRELEESRALLTVVPGYLDTCYKCGNLHISHGRFDCDNMFTDVDAKFYPRYRRPGDP